MLIVLNAQIDYQGSQHISAKEKDKKEAVCSLKEDLRRPL